MPLSLISSPYCFLRPLLKTVRFNVLKVIQAGSSAGGKKAFILPSSAGGKKAFILKGHMCGVLAKITKAKNSFNQRFQRLPSHNEIAERINVQESTVRLVCERNKLPLSLDRAVTDQGCMALQDIIRGPDEMMPETMLRKQLMKQEVEQSIAKKR